MGTGSGADLGSILIFMTLLNRKFPYLVIPMGGVLVVISWNTDTIHEIPDLGAVEDKVDTQISMTRKYICCCCFVMLLPIGDLT